MDHVRATSYIYFNPTRVKIMTEELKRPKAGATKPAPGEEGQDAAAAEPAGKQVETVGRGPKAFFPKLKKTMSKPRLPVN